MMLLERPYADLPAVTSGIVPSRPAIRKEPNPSCSWGDRVPDVVNTRALERHCVRSLRRRQQLTNGGIRPLVFGQVLDLGRAYSYYAVTLDYADFREVPGGTAH